MLTNQSIPEQTESQYRATNRISNSDLSELKRWIEGGKPFSADPKALLFGTIFHRMILEPHLMGQEDLSHYEPEKIHDLISMEYAVNYDLSLRHVLQTGRKEQVFHWKDERTGIQCKGKLDLVDQYQRHLIDFKTTSCKTEQSFFDSIFDYDYPRQAAFYLNALPESEYFEFVGVQKTAPYQLYRLPFHRDSEVIQQGRKQAEMLLGYAFTELNKPDGWRPSAWKKPDQETF